MKLLFVGSVYHQHIYNFSRALRALGQDIYAFNLSDPVPKSLNNNPFVKVWQKPSLKKRGVINFIYKTVGTIYKFASIKEDIDVVQFHYLDIYHTLPLLIIEKLKHIKVSCFVYGSDFLRAGKWTRKYLKCVFHLSDSIVCDSILLHKKLQDFMPSEREKFTVINFGSIIIDDLNQLLNNKSYAKSLVNDRIKVMCGYNGYPEQNHLKILVSLESFKDSIHLIIPMTYGVSPSYKDEILSYLKRNEFSYEVLTNFIPDKEWEKILINTDVFIHMQVSDAFSSSLAEHLFLGNIVINAEWLIYEELAQNEVYYLKANFNNLTDVFSEVITDYSKVHSNHQKNIEKMFKLKSLNYCCEHNWLPYYESIKLL